MSESKLKLALTAALLSVLPSVCGRDEEFNSQHEVFPVSDIVDLECPKTFLVADLLNADGYFVEADRVVFSKKKCGLFLMMGDKVVAGIMQRSKKEQTKGDEDGK